MISTSKLSRLENAQGRPQPRDIRDLVRYYGIEDAPLGASFGMGERGAAPGMVDRL